MRFLGIDLAWADAAAANETGVVALEPNGTITAAGWTVGVEDTVRWAETNAKPHTVLFVDAPLIVLNSDKQRLCEKQVGQRYWKAKVSANSSNLSSARLAGVRLRHELEALGWRYDDGTAGPTATGRTVCECYPYTTIVGAQELGYDTERPLYKRKPPKLRAADWRPIRAAACDELIRRMTALRAATPPLDLLSHELTAQLITQPSPIADRGYKHREDLIDACLSAWTASLWVHAGMDRCQVLGADDPLADERGSRATIIAPARPHQRATPPQGQ